MMARPASLSDGSACTQHRALQVSTAIALGAAMLTGCSTPVPTSVPTSTSAPQSSVAQVRPTLPAAAKPGINTTPQTPAVVAFEAQQHQAAQSAAALGRWFEAAEAWDVLLALHPQDSSLQRLQEQAEANARSEATERVKRAKAAQQRGDADAAWRLYLEALALQPGHEDAVVALRTLDRERGGRRQSFAPSALPAPSQAIQTSANVPIAAATQPAARTTAKRPPVAEKTNASEPSLGAATKASTGSLATISATRSAATFTAPNAAPSRQHNDIEHASLLARQGEIESAITLLLPHAQTGSDNVAARRLLADLYFRQAEKLPAGQDQAVLAALKQSLAFDPTHARAQQRLSQLQNGPTATPQR